MKYIICFIFLYPLCLPAQTDSIITQFSRKKAKINHTGMLVLTTWSAANIAGSVVGYGLTDSYEEKQFYLMNGAWGLINLSVALPGVLAKSKPARSIFELQKSQTKVEKIFLANALLDALYISGGICLKEYSYNQSDIKQQQRFNGFGNSVIIQGAGLLIFDTFMTCLNNRNRRKNLDPLLKNTTVSFTGNYIKVGYRF